MIEQNPTVKLDGKTLKEGTDYTLKYSNNYDPGTCKITITGKGNYTGSINKSFKIIKPNVEYRTHVQRQSWQGYVKNGASSGTSGKSLRLEGINIRLSNKPMSGSIQYRTHVQNIGWQGWKKDGEMSGTSGKSLRLEAIQIKLTGDISRYYDVCYRVHAQNFGWMNWACNGESAGTAGYSYRLEAIQIKLVPKGSFYRDYDAASPFSQNQFTGTWDLVEGSDSDLSRSNINLLRAYGMPITMRLYGGGSGYIDIPESDRKDFTWKAKSDTTGEINGTNGRTKLELTESDRLYIRTSSDWMKFERRG